MQLPRDPSLRNVCILTSKNGILSSQFTCISSFPFPLTLVRHARGNSGSDKVLLKWNTLIHKSLKGLGLCPNIPSVLLHLTEFPPFFARHIFEESIFCLAKPEWPSSIQCCARCKDTLRFPPKPPPMLVDTSASMWTEKAQLPWWPLYSHQVSHQR